VSYTCIYHSLVLLTPLPSYSILPALSNDGIIFSDIREGAYDGHGFVEYIQCLLPHMNPWPEARSVLVMDNCAIHHVDEVLPLCEEQFGVVLLFTCIC